MTGKNLKIRRKLVRILYKTALKLEESEGEWMGILLKMHGDIGELIRKVDEKRGEG